MKGNNTLLDATVICGENITKTTDDMKYFINVLLNNGIDIKKYSKLSLSTTNAFLVENNYIDIIDCNNNTKTEFLCKYLLEGNVTLVKKLFDFGYKLPESHKLVMFYVTILNKENTNEYNCLSDLVIIPESRDDELRLELINILGENGINFHCELSFSYNDKTEIFLSDHNILDKYKIIKNKKNTIDLNDDSDSEMDLDLFG